MVETIALVGMYRGIDSETRVSERWCQMHFATIHSMTGTHSPGCWRDPSAKRAKLIVFNSENPTCFNQKLSSPKIQAANLHKDLVGSFWLWLPFKPPLRCFYSICECAPPVVKLIPSNTNRVTITQMFISARPTHLLTSTSLAEFQKVACFWSSKRHFPDVHLSPDKDYPQGAIGFSGQPWLLTTCPTYRIDRLK